MRPILLSVLLLATIVLVSGCTSQPAGNATLPSRQPAQVMLKGVSLSPKNFGPDFAAFFPKAKQAGSIVMWNGPWQELGNPQAAPYTLVGLSKQFGFTPLVVAAIKDPDVTQANLAQLQQFAASFAEQYKPAYLGLGNEVNTLQNVQAFAAAFPAMAAAVKAKSPETKVFTVFNLERMKGLNGGLFGGVNDPNANQWALLSSFSAADVFAFTTYPGLIYKNPSEIPADYFAEIASKTSKPAAFTETGWFRTGPAGAPEWASSAQEQADYTRRFFPLVSGAKPLFAVWSFLYDQSVQEPFATMGLLQTSEETSPAWVAWIAGALP